jgi:hypothetical protein
MGRRWGYWALCLIVLMSACEAPATPVTTTQDEIATPPKPPSSTSSTVVSGLRSEFVAWIAPIDGDEARLGWEAFALPAARKHFAALAECWESAGFNTFAEQVRRFEPGMSTSSGRLLPDLATYRETGFRPQSLSLVDDVLAAADDSPENVASYVARSPEFGFRGEDVPAIQAIARRCSDLVQPPEFLSSIAGRGLGEQWLFRLGEIDRQEAIASLIDAEVLPCLRDVDPVFQGAESIDEWFALQFGEQINLDVSGGLTLEELEGVLTEWGQGFARCMEPLVEARRGPRLEARDEWIDQRFTELLQLQSDVDEFLAGG